MHKKNLSRYGQDAEAEAFAALAAMFFLFVVSFGLVWALILMLRWLM